ncbi:hypothetical protein ACS0TY_027198 [Phlomoides rotata]
MIILSWNARGLDNEQSRNNLYNFCRSYRPDWFAIYEPKVLLSSIPPQFWDSLNLSFFTENKRQNLRPNIWILCKQQYVTIKLISPLIRLLSLTPGWIHAIGNSDSFMPGTHTSPDVNSGSTL